MIKRHHQRNTSETYKIDQKSHAVYQDNNKRKSNLKNKSKTLTLVERSVKKVPLKQTLVEDLNPSTNNTNSFFVFGRKEAANKDWNLGIDKIVEAADSKRQITSHRSHREAAQNNYQKQNYDWSNLDDKNRKSVKSQGKSWKNKKGKNKNEKTKSTISLARDKGSRQLEYRTQKIEKSMKMLWECMGELWQNSRVSQYKSEKNNENLTQLKRKICEHEQKIMDLKFQINRFHHKTNLRV